MAERTGADALTLARALLDHLPPAIAPVRAVEPAIDHMWCFVVYWTLADSDDPPPPGAGPIAVPKAGGEAFYLGSHDLESELERARWRSDADPRIKQINEVRLDQPPTGAARSHP